MSGPHRRRLAVAGVAAVVLGALLLPGVAAAQTHGGCDDLLVTHTPDGSSGATAAVAITAQALDRDTDGWASVGWQVAPTTDLRTVLVTSPTGSTELPPTATMAEGPVMELRFCGAASDGGVATGGADDRSDGRTEVADRAPASIARTRATSSVGRSASPGAIFGAALGAAAGGLVLLLSRDSRNGHEVVR